jgi:pyruvate dehydrogenase E1 component alpha subunit
MLELVDLYLQMARARAYEVAVDDLWRRGLISGEMHLGTGEEAVAAGVVAHMREGDGLALTHRCSPALVARGIPMVAMLEELLGHSEGLCRGQGGHMHLFDRQRLAATSGIVGASLPCGAGFALAARRLRKHGLAVAFTGDGAMNQGMALESLNLAAAWALPLVVVCVDNGWAITTPAGMVTRGELTERARAFGLAVADVDGTDVEAVHAACAPLFERARSGKGPAFVRARSPRIDGHILGDPLLRVARAPLAEGQQTLGQVLGAALRGGGAGPLSRAGSITTVTRILARARMGVSRGERGDPMVLAQKRLTKLGVDHHAIDRRAAEETADAVAQASARTSGGGGG